MMIKVKTLTGKEISLDIEPNDKVERIKEKVEEKEGIPPQQQRLIFAGKQMNDEKTVADYKVSEGAPTASSIKVYASDLTKRCFKHDFSSEKLKECLSTQYAKAAQDLLRKHILARDICLVPTGAKMKLMFNSTTKSLIDGPALELYEVPPPAVQDEIKSLCLAMADSCLRFQRLEKAGDASPDMTDRRSGYSNSRKRTAVEPAAKDEAVRKDLRARAQHLNAKRGVDFDD